MAEFQTWERQVLPQGSIAAPQAGPSLAESFGAGLSELADAAAGAVRAVRKADELRAEKQWEIDQPKAAALVNQLQLQITEQLPELKAQAAPGLADYPDKINEAITRATEEALKENSDPRFQRYVRGYMDEFRVSSATTGIQERTVATLERDAAALQSLMDGQSKLVAKDFANYDAAAALFDETLTVNRHLGADRKAEFSRIAKHALAKAGLDALVDRDLEAADKVLGSGKLDGVLTADDEQFYRDAIESKRVRRESEARLVQQQQQEKLQADGKVAMDAAFKTARETGEYDLAKLAVIKTAYPDNFPEIHDALARERTIGHDNFVIPAQTEAQDQELEDKIKSQWAANPHNAALTEELENIKEQRRLKQAALKSNPEAYVRKWVPELQRGWDEVAKHPDDVDLLRKTMELSRRAQLARGVDAKNVRVLPELMGDFYLKVATGPDGAAAIPQIKEALGEDRRELLEQASKKASPLVNVALMLEPDQQRVCGQLLEINSNGGIAALEAALPKKYSTQSVLSRVQGSLDDLALSFAEQPGGAQVFERIRTSVYALTLNYIETQHMEPAEAAERAAREVATDRYSVQEFNGHYYRVPRRYGTEVIAETLQRYTADAIDYSKVDMPSYLQGLPPEITKLALVQNGFWTTRGDEQGLYLRTPAGAPVTIEGRAISLLWQDLLQLQRLQQQSQPSH
ncbi:hypothetical protein [Dongia sedimenti]|uniref:Uncharacterized protein n=1 Tax=Dongia sedimenti TaxID=3064282 RepID=A0ABU0YIE9_9PROT|nr:hypothetical protein [Rhodospirillaceae bacterium R-7]